MAKRKTVTTRAPSNKIIPTVPGFAEGGKDLLGMRPAVGRMNNNVLYAGLLGLVGGIGFLVYTNPRLIGQLMGTKAPPGATVTAPPMVQPGQAVTIQGAFNPPVPQAFYVVTNQSGQQVASGSLGSNVSTFSQQIPGGNLPNGSYTVTVSDTTPTGPAGGPTPGSIAGGGPGQMNTTAATLQQGLTGGGQLAAAQSGPESISLS